MKKLICVLVVFLFFCSVPLESCMTEQSDTIYVDDDNREGPWDGSKDHPFEQIQDALDYAKEGDTVFVNQGQYVGNIFVEKSVNLIGEQRDKTVIKSGKHTIWVLADDVTIMNFSIVNSSRYFSGIYVVSSDNKIVNNLIYNNYDGVLLDNTNNNVICNNRIFRNYDRNVRIEFSDSCKFFSNYIGSGGYGIYLWSSSENSIYDNVVDHCEWGISLGDFCFGNTIYHNTLMQNKHGNGFDESDENSWDNGYPSGGNFWSDYTGEDDDNDGIGDSAYELSEKAIDRFPLMNPLNISKPEIVIKSGIGFHAEVKNVGSSLLTGIVSIQISKKNGDSTSSSEVMIIDLESSNETLIAEDRFGFGMMVATVEFGIWTWEQDAFLFGPFWINF